MDVAVANNVIQGVVGTVQGVTGRVWRESRTPKSWSDSAKTRFESARGALCGRCWASEASPKLEKSGQGTVRRSKGEVQGANPGKHRKCNGKSTDFWMLPGSRIMKKPLVL